ncbi:MAG: carbohydrate kinase [Chloroflexi bacterium]|nr:carbohydrate kinase [Chloroflexota bacterium]
MTQIFAIWVIGGPEPEANMAQRCILTIDVGTSGTKTAVYTTTGAFIHETTFAYNLHRPHPLWAEIDANIWWQAVCATVPQALAEGGVAADEVAGIGVDGVGWTLIPVDEQAKPLAPAMIWLDRRAADETAWLNALPEASRLVSLAANPLDAAYITPKLLWMQRQRPQIFAAAHQFLAATGFIVARLTGEFTCDYTQAYGYHFFDIAQERWSDWALDKIGVPSEKMPRLCACTDVVGGLTAAAAAQMGLKPGIPVIAGCLDAAVGALGAGVTRPGQTNEQGGQAGGVGISLDHVVVEPRLIFSHHVLPGQYLLQAGTVGGGSLGWFRDQFGQMETAVSSLIPQSPFELFSLQAAQSPPGANGLIFLPYMAGERTPLWSSVARGVFFGLSYTTTRADMLRAIMEGCAFAVYDNLQIAQAHGVHVSEYLGSGGATQSALWCQIKADVYGRPFVVAQQGNGRAGGHGLGLFALTAQATGHTDNAGNCVDRLLPQRRVYTPDPQRHARYQALFQVYRRVSRTLLAEFSHLDAITRRIE